MFITLEGPDGSGKTQQIHLLSDFLKEKGYKVYFSREPGGTEIGDQIRDVIMNLENTAMDPRTETLLFCASRAQIVSEIIRPKLEEGYIVILDRYADSTLAYQGYGHGFDLQLIKSLLAFATGELIPDLTILLDLDAETGLTRRKKGGGEWNRLDDYQLALHKRVRTGYLEMAKQDPERWRVISADQPIEMVQSDLRKVLLDNLE